MSRIIVKPNNNNEDFYVEWSLITDSPIYWGRAEVLGLSADRKKRADETGTSSFHGDGNWEDAIFIVSNYGNRQWILPRENLQAFCHAIDSKRGEEETIKRIGREIEED